MNARIEHEHKHEVRIHIDRKPYQSPNPATGAALYALGHVPTGYELFREVRGDQEDEPVANGKFSLDFSIATDPAEPRGIISNALSIRLLHS